MGMAVAGMIITSDSGSFPHSLCLAPVSKPFKLILNQYLISQYKRTIVLYLLFYVLTNINQPFSPAQVSTYAKVFSGCCFRMSSCDGDHKGHRNGMFSGNFHRKSWDMMCKSWDLIWFNLLNNRNSSNRNFTWN